jgi:hypothetical protein
MTAFGDSLPEAIGPEGVFAVEHCSEVNSHVIGYDSVVVGL